MDGTENQKDTSGETQDSSKGQQGTSEKTTETFTKEQVEKAKSDALATAGRDAKALEQKAKEAEAVMAKATKLMSDVEADRARWQAERDDAEIESARDDNDAMSRVRALQKARAKEAELAKREKDADDREGKVAEMLQEAGGLKKERDALEIATKHNVDIALLLKFTDGSSGAMEELAKSLPKKGEVAPLKPDSGKTIGGEGMPESAKGKIKAGFDELHK